MKLPPLPNGNNATHYLDVIEYGKACAEKMREACVVVTQTMPNPFLHCQVSAHAADMSIADVGKAIRALEIE